MARLINEAFLVKPSSRSATGRQRARSYSNAGRRRISRARRAARHDRRVRLSDVPRRSRAVSACCPSRPARQGRGLGRRLIDAVEARARARGCLAVDIHIVNLREELPDFLPAAGYVDSGTLPFSDADRASRPCHFIVMTKTLG